MTEQMESLDDAQRAIVEAVSVANAPLSASVTADATGLSIDDIMAAGDTLIRDAWVTDDPAGYGPTDQTRSIELSHARRTQTALRVGAALRDESPALAGQLLVAGGDQKQGFELLADAALASESITETAHDLAQSALAISEQLEPSPGRLGELHMVVGRYHQSVGNSDVANDAFVAAAFGLDGNPRIDALGFCAATADDRQRPQEAERWLAAAQYEALRQGEMQKYGSLLTLHARTLSRIGFPTEADAALAKGKNLLTDASPIQHALAATNEAWILLDRGYARQAEAAFAALAFEANRAGDMIGGAFHTVYHARALFAAGKPADATALLSGIESPTGVLSFLKQLALTEGAGWLEQWDMARGRAETLVGITEAEVPQWENIARYHLARALLGVGQVDDAAAQLAEALEACPPGADGWRWRMRCRELSLAVTHANGQPWDQTAAENLTDELLVARWFDTAADLLIRRAEAESDPELARQAAGLAESVGNPLLTIRAAHVGDLWDSPQANSIAREARSLHASLSADEQGPWADLPQVAAALQADPPPLEEDHATLVDDLNETLQAIGLQGTDELLTPAQRHQSGLVRRRSVARTSRRWLGVAAATVAVIGISVGTSYALREEPPVQTIVVTQTVPSTTTTTMALTVEQTELARPDTPFSGSTVFGGDNARTGLTDHTGIETAGGFYWSFAASDTIRSTPVTYGSWVYVGSSDHFVYALNQTTGERLWTEETNGAVLSTAATGQVALSDGAISQGSIDLVVIGSDDGSVWARKATSSTESWFWEYPTGAPVRTTPIIDGALVIVAGGDGRVHAIRGADGEQAWVYPAEGSVGTFTSSPSLSNGIVYAGDDEGVLHLIDAETGVGECTFDSRSAITTTPSIVDGVVYFGNNSTNVFQLPEGTCPGFSSSGALPMGFPTTFDVTISEGRLLMPQGTAIISLGLPTADSLGPFYDAGANIVSPSIIANDVLYFGDENGVLHAVRASTLEPLWTFQTDGPIRSAPSIGDGVVFVTSTSGTVYAIGSDN